MEIKLRIFRFCQQFLLVNLVSEWLSDSSDVCHLHLLKSKGCFIVQPCVGYLIDFLCMIYYDGHSTWRQGGSLTPCLACFCDHILLHSKECVCVQGDFCRVYVWVMWGCQILSCVQCSVWCGFVSIYVFCFFYTPLRSVYFICFNYWIMFLYYCYCIFIYI